MGIHLRGPVLALLAVGLFAASCSTVEAELRCSNGQTDCSRLRRRAPGVYQQGVAVRRGFNGRSVLVVKETRITKHPGARVRDVVLKRPTAATGYWRGYVEGHGKITLYLKIFRSGRLESTREIGHVLFQRGESAVPFNYRGPLPAGDHWSWQIVGRAR